MKPLDYDLTILGASAGGLEAALLALQERSRVALLTLGLPLSPETIASLNTLNSAGLDVINGSGYFLPKDRGFQATERSRPLQSRTYLLAVPSVPLIPPLPGLDRIPYHTTVPPASPAEHWLILGDSLDCFGDAQTLLTQGHSVTLLLQTPLESALPQRLQLYLEAQGVQIFTPIVPTAIDSCPEQGIRVTASQGQWMGDRLLLSLGKQAAPLDLQLQALHPQITLPLRVKSGLQSPLASRLYGCGSILGGLALDSLARYEARIAVPNALYGNDRPCRYDSLPYARLASPLVTQLGWTLEGASQHWKRSALKWIAIADFCEADFGDDPLCSPYLQVLLHRRGQILGAQGIGTRSGQALQVMALALQQGLSWAHLLRSLPGGEVADLLYGVQAHLRIQCPKAPSWESFFNWKRTGYI